MCRVVDKIHTELNNTEKKKNSRYVKNREKKIQKYRLWIQSAFAALCAWIGFEFYLFVKFLESGGLAGSSYRPPGVEGFLPISSLMSLYYFFLSGEIHPAHPAGLFILIAIMVMSLVFGKSFCSWGCPVGFLSENLGDLSQKLFKRRLQFLRWLDYPLRSLKYLLLGFFVYSIFFIMGKFALLQFLDSPYNQVADIKMYYFFADISQVTLIVIIALFVLSFFIRNFWCRYLCPYGALLGFISFFSPFKIKRNAISCIDCGRCAKACPSFIKVDQVQTAVSDECHSCLKCLDACPVADTLEYRFMPTGRKFGKKWVAAGVVASFVIFTGVGMLSGYWQNNISTEEYLNHRQYLQSYGHPTSTDELSEMNASNH